MPLQGLEQATKDDLLRKVVQRKLSLKELRQAGNLFKKDFHIMPRRKNWRNLKVSR